MQESKIEKLILEIFKGKYVSDYPCKGYSINLAESVFNLDGTEKIKNRTNYSHAQNGLDSNGKPKIKNWTISDAQASPTLFGQGEKPENLSPVGE